MAEQAERLSRAERKRRRIEAQELDARRDAPPYVPRLKKIGHEAEDAAYRPEEAQQNPGRLGRIVEGLFVNALHGLLYTLLIIVITVILSLTAIPVVANMWTASAKQAEELPLPKAAAKPSIFAQVDCNSLMVLVTFDSGTGVSRPTYWPFVQSAESTSFYPADAEDVTLEPTGRMTFKVRVPVARSYVAHLYRLDQVGIEVTQRGVIQRRLSPSDHLGLELPSSSERVSSETKAGCLIPSSVQPLPQPPSVRTPPAVK